MVSERVDPPTMIREDDVIAECYIRMQGVLRGLSDQLRQITARSAMEFVEIKQILAAELAKVKPVQTMINADQVTRDDLLSKMDKSSVHQTHTSALRTHVPVIEENFCNGKELCKGSNPDKAITCGASDQTDILSNESIEKVRDRLLLDIISPSRGLETTGGVMTDLIPRNTSVPIKKEQVFSTNSDNQASELIQIYEGIYFYSTLTRAKFDELNMDLFKKCKGPAKKRFRDVKMDKSSVHDVVIVGGPIMIPYSSPVELDGYPPPIQVSYVPGDSFLLEVDPRMRDRNGMLAVLKENLLKAQQMMKAQADKGRSERQFEVGHWVYEKLQPYRQRTLLKQNYSKPVSLYYGPFQVLQRICQVAYKLALPDGCSIHPTFHVSKLKRHLGQGKVVQVTLPQTLDVTTSVLMAVLDHRMVKRNHHAVSQVLIQWSNATMEEAA